MNEPVLDLTVFQELCDTAGAEFVADLARTFGDDAPGLLAELRLAQAAAEPGRFRRAAHSIKSNARTFGAARLAERARALELGGLPAGAAPVGALAAELDLALARLQEQTHG